MSFQILGNICAYALYYKKMVFMLDLLWTLNDELLLQLSAVPWLPPQYVKGKVSLHRVKHVKTKTFSFNNPYLQKGQLDGSISKA